MHGSLNSTSPLSADGPPAIAQVGAHVLFFMGRKHLAAAVFLVQRSMLVEIWLYFCKRVLCSFRG